jgi:hypothetical protein
VMDVNVTSSYCPVALCVDSARGAEEIVSPWGVLREIVSTPGRR